METTDPTTYLGDGVYATFDGWHIWLDTRAQSPNNRIALEPNVFKNLINFAKQAKQREE